MRNGRDLRVNISLRDRLSTGLGQISGTLTRLNAQAVAFQDELRGNFDNMVAGFGSAMAAGASVYAAIAPGVELERALKSVGGFGLEGDLSTLRDKAQTFSREFGGTSAEFVNNAQALKRAIGDVNEAELGQITAATTKLVTATGSDIEQISQYMGRLYHTYQDEADKIGKVDFVSHLANINAMAVQLSGKSADHIAGAMESITSLAKNFGIGLEEQMAVVATLSMEHGEGDTASFYEAFIREGNNLSELGIQTIGDDGKMLGMLEILEQVKAKFGEEIDANEFKQIEEVAGDSASVFATLLRKEADFRAALGNMKAPGTDTLDELAEAHTDTLKQLGGSWGVLRENLSQAIMPVVDTVAGGFIWLLDTVSNVTQAFPNLTSTVLVGIVGLTALISVISMGSGMLAMMRTGISALSPAFNIASATLGGLTGTTQGYTIATMVSAAKTRLQTAATWASTLATRVQLGAMGQLINLQMMAGNRYTSLTRAMQGLTAASLRQAAVSKIVAAGQAALNLVMSLNPIGILVVALAAAAIMIMRYWEPISSFFSGFVEGLRASGLFDMFSPLVGVFGWIWDKVKGIGEFLFGWLKPVEYANDELASFASTGMMVGAMVGDFFGAIGDTMRSLFASVIDVLNLIPGIDIDMPDVALTLNVGSASALAEAARPTVEPPEVTMPTVETPEVALATIAPPEMALAAIEPPEMALPTVDVPRLDTVGLTSVEPANIPDIPHITASEDVVAQAMSDMQPYTHIATPASTAPDMQMRSLRTAPAQQVKQVQTGDIHIHNPLKSFSLLGLDEETILTVG